MLVVFSHSNIGTVEPRFSCCWLCEFDVVVSWQRTPATKCSSASTTAVECDGNLFQGRSARKGTVSRGAIGSLREGTAWCGWLLAEVAVRLWQAGCHSQPDSRHNSGFSHAYRKAFAPVQMGFISLYIGSLEEKQMATQCFSKMQSWVQSNAHSESNQSRALFTVSDWSVLSKEQEGEG